MILPQSTVGAVNRLNNRTCWYRYMTSSNLITGKQPISAKRLPVLLKYPDIMHVDNVSKRCLLCEKGCLQ